MKEVVSFDNSRRSRLLTLFVCLRCDNTIKYTQGKFQDVAQLDLLSKGYVFEYLSIILSNSVKVFARNLSCGLT